MKKFIFAALAAIAVLASCQSDSDYVMIYAKYLMSGPEGGSWNVTVWASGEWTATVSTPEDLSVSITPETGTGTSDAVITVEPYSGREEDYALGYIVLVCGKAKSSFPVYQINEEYQKELEEQNSGDGSDQ